MTIVFFRNALCITLLCFFFAQSKSQVACPTNIDFESGDFTNWECYAGSVTAISGVNTLSLFPSPQLPMKHSIIRAGTNERDRFGLFPVNCPNGSGYSIKLGNEYIGAEAEAVHYTFTIPANAVIFSLIYHYAVVLQNPNHSPEQQPRFRARIVDVATGGEVDCVSFDFTASASLPGFQQSPQFSDVVYKDWTPITIDLSSYRGKTLRLEFITSDCTLGGHFGYAYVDVNTECNGMFTSGVHCTGDTFASFNAPPGFSSYTWYADNSFSQVIGSSQTLIINPAPPQGVTFPLIIVPYPGFGCRDTLFATLLPADKPPAVAGPDHFKCSKETVQLGGPSTQGYNYLWSPSQWVSNPAVSNPFTRTNMQNPVNFVLKTTDSKTGCFSFDTVRVTPFVVDTSSVFSGRTAYCPGETVNNLLAVSNPSVSAQWYSGNLAIAGGTSLSYQPAGTGVYWAQIRQNGCIDSTRQHNIALSANPRASFEVNRTVQCLNEPILFGNSTSIADGSPMQFQWRFSDGTSSAERSPWKSFAGIGEFSASLLAVSEAGCRDSVTKTITVLKECGVIMPTAFTPNSDGLNDILRPYLAGVEGLKRFSVYNRMGQLVFSTVKEGEGWDGKHKGMPLDPAVFIWTVEYIGNNGRQHIIKGTVALIR